MIYIIGDSHVSVFSGTDNTHDGLRHIQPEFGTCYTLSQGQLKTNINRFEQKIPYFCPIKIGSHTAYNSFDKLGKIIQAITEYNIDKENDYIFLCFGEIDIRNHIGYISEETFTPINETIKYCVDKYSKTILHIKELGYKVGVYGSPPSSQGYSYTVNYGSVAFRNSMTITFNEYLKELCINNDIIFKDISKLMMLPDGTTDQKYIMDDIHLSQQAMPLLIEEFKDIIPIV